MNKYTLIFAALLICVMIFLPVYAHASSPYPGPEPSETVDPYPSPEVTQTAVPSTPTQVNTEEPVTPVPTLGIPTGIAVKNFQSQESQLAIILLLLCCTLILLVFRNRKR